MLQNKQYQFSLASFQQNCKDHLGYVKFFLFANKILQTKNSEVSLKYFTLINGFTWNTEIRSQPMLRILSTAVQSQHATQLKIIESTHLHVF